jgi:iron-sulfur cluster repair protein YtfE (RIC family)
VRGPMSKEIPSRFSTARASILNQHDELRRQLRTGVALAGAAARRDQPCIEELPNLIDSLLARFSEHLVFEEATLVPLLRHGDSVDRAHADRLVKEHNHQRKELQVLLMLARSGCEPQTVALSFQNLLNDLIADMESEERWLTEVGTDGGLGRSAS